jgi:hypothetical protein
MRPIKLSQFSVDFDPKAISEGDAILNKGGVRLNEGATDQFFEAKVPFFRRFHDVWMDLKPDGTVEFECTCPHLENTGLACAHLYVLVQLANRRAEEEAQALAPKAEPILPMLVVCANRSGPLRVNVFGVSSTQGTAVPRPLPIDAETLERIEDAELKALVLALMPFAGGRRNLGAGGGFVRQEGPWAIDAGQRIPWLERAIGTERLFVSIDGTALAQTPLSKFDVISKTLAMTFAPDQDAGRVRLEAKLVSDAGELSLQQGTLLSTDEESFVVIGETLHRVDHFGAQDWLTFGLSGKSLPVQTDRVPALIRELGSRGALPQVVLPGAKASVILSEPPTPRARISANRGDYLLKVDFLYGGRAVAPENAERIITDSSSGAQYARQLAFESQGIQALERTQGVDASEGIVGRYRFEADAEWLATQLLNRGFRVELFDRPIRRAGPLRVNLHTTQDWLTVTGEVRFDDVSEMDLDHLLEAMKQERPFVQLPDGTMGHLSEDLRKKLIDLSGLLGRSKTERVPLTRAPFFEAFLGPDASLYKAVSKFL